jgi:ethanolamine utilization protein EutK
MKIDAFGLLEVRGLVTAIEAADAMLKSAHVRLVRQHEISPGFISLIVEGDLGACRAAVDAGAAAAARLGEVVSRLEIGRPDGDTETMALSFISSFGAQAKTKPAEPVPLPAAPDGGETPPEAADGPTDEDSAPDEAVAARAAMLAFIARRSRGRNWAEIEKSFPEYADYRHVLEEMVEEGILRKKGPRYLHNGE